MKVRLFPFLCLSLIVILSSCATLPPPSAVRVDEPPPPAPAKPEMKSEPTPPDLFRAFVDEYQLRGAKAEENGELYQSLMAWRIVRSFRPEDTQVEEKVRRLEKRVEAVADDHFRKGLDHLRSGSREGARREFLMALANEPEHKGALAQLKSKDLGGDYSIYEVRPGDTTGGIAQRMYRDSGKGFLIAYFNELADDEQLKPGAVLKIPSLEREPKREVKQPVKRAAKMKAGSPPRIYDKARAENHYRKGLAYFLAEDLEAAAREWEEALRLNPDHPNAKRDLERARGLLVSMGSK